MSYKGWVMRLRSRAACVLTFVVACGGKLPPPSAAARGVVLADEPPPPEYSRLREISVTSGKGCGVLGESGSREAAEALMRHEAAKLGARYVQLTSFEGPRPNHQCLEHEHRLSGVAYRGPSAAAPASVAHGATLTLAPARPAPSAVTAPEPSSSHLGAPRVCIPGATQACLGPGACQGAQACRDDASGYLPCDCGPARTR